MRRRRLLTLSGALLAGGLSDCLADSGALGAADTSTPYPARTSPAVTPSIGDQTLATLVRGTNELAFDLYHELPVAEAENGMVSPVSVSTALAMTYAGARGTTRDQMRSALHYGLPDDDLHAAFNSLQRRLNERGESIEPTEYPNEYDDDDEPVPFRLNTVNAVWGQTGFPFRDAYLRTLADHYGGGLNEVDYENDAERGRTRINEWVASRTEDRIPELLPRGSLTSGTRLVLTNAIYFLANWHSTFDTSETEKAPFTTATGSTKRVPMMSQTETFPHAEVDGTQAVELPYVGEDVSMLVVLPERGTFDTFETEFGPEAYGTLVDSLEAGNGVVALPRFEFSSAFRLEDALETLGMPAAFDGNLANFSGITEDDAGRSLHIDEVYHDAHVAVDEQGTEAAAATGGVLNLTSATTNQFEFVANRPFLFVIRDRPTETVLFVGRVADPTSS